MDVILLPPLSKDFGSATSDLEAAPAFSRPCLGLQRRRFLVEPQLDVIAKLLEDVSAVLGHAVVAVLLVATADPLHRLLETPFFGSARLPSRRLRVTRSGSA